MLLVPCWKPGIIRSHTDYSLPGRAITLTQWAPELLFEVKAYRLKLLRMKGRT
ncbi:hypothetical protein ENINMA064M1_08620 [Enterobacter intestinihominis]